MTKKTFTEDKVRAAFQRLEDLVAASGVEAECLWAIHAATEDCIQFLTGDYSPEGERPAEDALRRVALGARTVEAFDAAVLLLVETFDDREQVAAARDEIDPAWRPSPVGNEAMLEGLVTYGEKQAGALGRGSARGEAEVFAVMEARRTYWRMVRG